MSAHQPSVLVEGILTPSTATARGRDFVTHGFNKELLIKMIPAL